MTRICNVLTIAALFLGAGCSESPYEVTDGSEITPQQAQADCEDFVANVYCPGFMSCIPGFTMYDCLATLPGFDCSQVTGENGHLAECEYQITHSPCKFRVGNGNMLALPLSCTGVFLFPQ
jgi:hypothetical protein